MLYQAAPQRKRNRDRHPEQARENMAQLLTGTREFLERELTGPLHEMAEEAGTAVR